MRKAIWLGFSLLALLWTGGALLAAELAHWAAQALASGEAVSLAKDAAQWPVPDWMALWVEPSLVRVVQDIVLWGAEMLQHFQPLIGSAAGWLVPLVWMLWGLGMLVMLLLTVSGHVLLGYRFPRQQRRH